MALALSGHRRTWAAAVSVLAAVTLAIAVAGRGCSVTTPGPEVAVRNLIAATAEGNRQAVFALLSPQTQAKLEEKAERATDLVGSNVRYTALDLISIGASNDVPPPTSIKVAEWRAADHAVVEIVSAAGRAHLDVVRVKGKWRVDLPTFGTAP